MSVCNIMQNKRLNLTENMPLTKRKDSILRKDMCVHAKSLQLYPTLCNAMNSSPPGSSVQEFSIQEPWSGLPCPLSGDLPNPGIELCFLCLLHWQVGSLPPPPPGKPKARVSPKNFHF